MASDKQQYGRYKDKSPAFRPIKKREERSTRSPSLSKIVPSGAYVVPLTPYCDVIGLWRTEWSTHI